MREHILCGSNSRGEGCQRVRAGCNGRITSGSVLLERSVNVGQ